MIHIARDGSQLGSFSLEQVNAMLAAGQLRSTDLAWWQGAPDWSTLAKAPGVLLPSPTAPGAAAPPGFQNGPQPVQPAPVSPVVPAASPYAPPSGSLTPVSLTHGPVPDAVVTLLGQTRPWVSMVGILGLITTLLFLGFTFFSPSMASRVAVHERVSHIVNTIGVYLLTAVLYLYPSIKLIKFSSRIKKLKQSRSFSDLEAALLEQKAFWRYLGLISVIILGVFVAGGLTMAGLALNRN